MDLARLAFRTACLALLAFVPNAAAQRGDVRPPFKAHEFMASAGGVKRTAPGWRCGPAAEPMTDMSGLKSFYLPDRTQSRIDHVRWQAYSLRTQSNTRMKQQLLALQQQWIAFPDQRHAIGACIGGALSRWARADALLLGIDRNDVIGRRQAILIIAWTAPAIATAYELAEQSRGMTPAQRRAIVSWAAAMSRLVRNDFAPKLANRSEQPSNHSYWAAAGVASLASITDDDGALMWAIAEMSRGLASATDDGGLPREVARGAKALDYQNFALKAMALVVRTADANGVTLSADDKANLSRVAKFTLLAWHNPNLMARRAGTAQLRRGDMLEWIDILLPYFRRHDPALARTAEAAARRFRPFASSFLGIDVTAALALTN